MLYRHPHTAAHPIITPSTLLLLAYPCVPPRFPPPRPSGPLSQVPPADVVIIEGILVLHMPEIRQMLNMKVYVDTDDDVRLARRCVKSVV